MRTVRTELRWAMVVLAAATCLPSLTSLHAEERNANLRRRVLQLNAITGTDAIKGEVQSLLKDKREAKKLLHEAAGMAREKPQPFSYNATLILGESAYSLRDYRTSETFYRLHLEQATKLRSVKGLLTAYGGLIAAVYANGQYAEAEKLCQEAAEHELIAETVRNLEVEKDADAEKELRRLNEFVFNVLKQQAYAIAKQGDMERATDKIGRLFKEREGWAALNVKAEAYRVGGKNQDAIKAYEKAIDKIKTDKTLSKDDKDSLVDDLQYTLSGVYIDAGDLDKAVEQLKTLLKKDPDNPSYNNDLGFIWADHDMNLEESEKLIRKAIEEDRKTRQKRNKGKTEAERANAAYLDSLGWVLYKQKKYDEACKLLRQAVSQEEGEHIEIMDHLGDALMASGQKAEALAIWKRAVDAASDTQREQKRKEEVQKKIKANE